MILTKAGADYALAVLLLSAAGLATGEGLFAALALGLAFTSLLSLLMLRLRTPRAIEVRVVEPKVRVFKGETGTIALRIPGAQGSWAHVEVESARVEGPVNSSVIRNLDEISLSVKPTLAGRFTKVEVELGLQDAIDLFAMRRNAGLAGVAIDSLPLSLLGRAQRTFLPPLVVGESPAGTAGKGQEFYGIEEYTERSESKDILWKRAAKEPNKPLLARIREANNPESVIIGVVHDEMDEGTKGRNVDLQCEALGILGRSILSAGIGVEIMGPDGETHRADTDDELVESIMEISTRHRTGAFRDVAGGRLNVLVVVGETDEDERASTMAMPTILIGGSQTKVLGRNDVNFSGVENLTGILNLVLAT